MRAPDTFVETLSFLEAECMLHKGGGAETV